jgi:3-hydroxy-3-methylglutaryl CoA synthase
MVGILAYGAYVPQRRLQRAVIAQAHAWFAPALKGLAKGERAIANWDEDAITMAVEAARDCLVDRPRDGVGALTLASTTLPFADRQNAGIVKEALVLNDEISALDAGGSLRAGTSALIHALATAADRETLCVASDRRIGQPGSETEMLSGDAAAALLLGQGDVIAEFIGSHSVTVDFVDHFRAAGSRYDYGWESRWIREEGYLGIMANAVAQGCARMGIDPAAVTHAILPVAVRGVPDAIARRTGLSAGAIVDPLVQGIGNSGAAHPLLMLTYCLETAQPGDLILLSGFGQGCDVLFFRATARIGGVRPRNGVSGWLARRQQDDNYLRYLSVVGELDIERGMRAEADNKPQLTALYRNRKTVFGLVGGRCTRTGTIQFPPSDISVAPNEKAYGTQEDYPLADRPARILTYTADLLAYSPSPPSCYGMIEFEGGGRMAAEFTDVPDLEAVAVGRPMRMMFRIKAIDEPRGFARYFWKAVPVELTSTVPEQAAI